MFAKQRLSLFLTHHAALYVNMQPDTPLTNQNLKQLYFQKSLFILTVHWRGLLNFDDYRVIIVNTSQIRCSLAWGSTCTNRIQN